MKAGQIRMVLKGFMAIAEHPTTEIIVRNKNADQLKRSENFNENGIK